MTCPLYKVSCKHISIYNFKTEIYNKITNPHFYNFPIFYNEHELVLQSEKEIKYKLFLKKILLVFKKY